MEIQHDGCGWAQRPLYAVEISAIGKWWDEFGIVVKVSFGSQWIRESEVTNISSTPKRQANVKVTVNYVNTNEECWYIETSTF